MVQKTIDRLSKLNAGEIVKCQWNISDFENIENISSLLRNSDFKKDFILLLGNTLGNFEINELLYEVRRGMKEGDILLIGNGLNNKHIDDIVKAYKNKFLDAMLSLTLTQIGFKKEDIEYGARFRNSRVEMYYTVNKDVTLSFFKDVEFSKGDQIIVAISYKYDNNDFMSYLKMYFGYVRLFVSKDGSYALALCKK